MRPFTELLSFQDALAAVLAAASPIERIDSIGLDEAGGRVAAEDVIAPVDVPPFDRAAMDGYAVIAQDTAGATRDAPRSLIRTGELFTGHVESERLAPGRALAIATGAPVPPGATAVVMVEQTRREGDRIDVFAEVQPGQHIGRRGADIRNGASIVCAGDLLTPGRIGALAGVGTTDVRVFAKPSVAIFSTGDEVVPPGQPLGAGQLFDINRYTLSAAVRQHGGTAVPLAIPRDTLNDLDRALDAASPHDLAVFSGGSSVGDRDLMVDALRARGTVIFHGIAVKPGKPTLFGRLGGTLVLGMPGYPTSCLSNAYMLLVPLLRALGRLPPWRPETRRVPLRRAIASAPDRHQFYTVRIVEGGAEPAFKASGDITSMAHADGYIEIPVGSDGLPAGTPVTVALF